MFTPSPDFLSDIVAFESALLGISIPISIEIVSRISERYKSNIITNNFLNDRTVKYSPSKVKNLPFLLIINVLLAIILRFFFTVPVNNDSNSSSIMKMLLWISLGYAVTIVIIFLRFWNLLLKYMTSTNFILEKFINEAKELLK
jgi:hypothetical protein